jgi:hypothetical protein
MGQKDGKKWTAAADLQPTISKADSLPWCIVSRSLVQIKRGIFGSGKAQTAAIPGGIARICNTARAEKTVFYVPDSVKRCTRLIALAARGIASPAGVIRAILPRVVARRVAFVIAARALGLIAVAVISLGLVMLSLIARMITLGLFAATLFTRLVALAVSVGVLLAACFVGLAGIALAPGFPFTQDFAFAMGLALTLGPLAFTPVIAVVVPAPVMAGWRGHRVAVGARWTAVDIGGLLIHAIARRLGHVIRVVRVARNHGATRDQRGKRNGGNNAGKMECHGSQTLTPRQALCLLRKALEKRPGGALKLREPMAFIKRLTTLLG